MSLKIAVILIVCKNQGFSLRVDQQEFLLFRSEYAEVDSFFSTFYSRATRQEKRKGIHPCLRRILFVLNQSELSCPHPFYPIDFLLKLLVEGQFLSILVLALLYTLMVD